MQERAALMMLRDRTGSNGGPEADIFAPTRYRKPAAR